MDRYRRMATLVAVVESGSLRRAARELGLTASAVSQQIRRLEQETGVTLLRRSTRRLALTEAGEAFYEGCVAMVAAARGAHERLADLQEQPVGELRVSAPAGFAAIHLVRALTPFMAAHPALALRLVVSDEALDIIKERIDLAITISRPLPSSSLVRRHLADWPLVLVAAPEYLARRGTPRTPDDLAQHDFLALPSWHHTADVLTGPSGELHRVGVSPRVTSNNQFAIRQLTVMGLGLSFHVEPEVAEEMAAGRLVRVLPEWSSPTLSVDALMPARTRQPAKIRLALDVLRGYLDRTGPQPRRRNEPSPKPRRAPTARRPPA
jgi:LysR family transcriptional regulator, transcriptional activator for aaeXAB operon